jgi:hypothetical protein|tara:strand:+ start:71 stop:259 length:189 start_codon:yes stop_codon:yes gene_type:complete
MKSFEKKLLEEIHYERLAEQIQDGQRFQIVKEYLKYLPPNIKYYLNSFPLIAEYLNEKKIDD